MLDLPGHLTTIAEVAAAFTGFAGLVSVLGTSHVEPKIRSWRVRLIIISSLAAMFGALVPSTLQLLISEGAFLWRVSSAILLLMVAGQLALVHRWMPAEIAIGSFRLLYGPTSTALTVCNFLFQFALIAVVVGYIPSTAPGVYSLALIFLLVASATHFLRLVSGNPQERPAI